ncbi:mediator of RNA polymerase II transcription subunit 30-like isoform X2 [Biomphalaria glabrata]|uniref:Mediator of RNA polymerase II transcription subunit 30 n=1 Tax=Biomphalaria glabrata TaxID=6526 RepID=A0A9W2ZAC8_BIOGL|nr:mediator of RNA polymerase II transcription subunit 30-like isoform X2 [Biomphalaria glabrata]
MKVCVEDLEPNMASQAPVLSQAPQHHYSLQREWSHQSNSMMSPASTSQLMSPTKDNAVNICGFGQEIVQDIVSKAQEVFNLLKANSMQLPNNVTFHGQQYTERKGKLAEQLQQVTMNFKRLRAFYSKVNELCEQIEIPSEQELVPYVGQEVDKTQSYSEVYLYVSEQHRDMLEQIHWKNQQLKEVIDSMRSIIWEINTMITMRKT